MPLVDNHNRVINYVRIAVTDRCNLRCFYCMPESGIDYVRRSELMTYEELIRLVDILTALGIKKLRITGGEPFLRKDMMDFLKMVAKSDIEDVHITTNGTLTYDLIPELKDLGVRSINLSLDTLNRERFAEITRRDQFDTVMRTFDRLLEYEIATKINMVVMEGKNLEDIIPMATLARQYPVSVRYIEEMPFNGTGSSHGLPWNHHKILAELQRAFPSIVAKPKEPTATATRFSVEGFKGDLGIIAAYSRTFCGTCNRLRITPKGMLRTCLYDQGVFNIKELMRQGASNMQIRDVLLEAIGNRAKDGFEAEARRWESPLSESMSTIGG